MTEKQPEQLAKLPVSAFKGSQDYLRTLAISRLALNTIDNFQASWVTQGKKIGQMTLFFGANDLGSTMMEENVVSEAGVSFRLGKEELNGMIQDAGFSPAIRDNSYRIRELV